MALRVLPPPGKDHGKDHAGPHSHVVQVAIGKDHGLLLTDEGIVYSWSSGDDKFGQLGRTAMDEKKRDPAPVERLKTKIIVQIACGTNHCLALSIEGQLFAWGNNKAGQIGTGLKAIEDPTVPNPATRGKTDSKAKDGRSGLDRKPYKPEGEMRVLFPTQVTLKPKPGELEEAVRVKSCSCGPESSACVTMTGEVYIWGAISHYLLSQQYSMDPQDEENCTMPVRLRSKPELSKNFCPDQISVCREQIGVTLAPMTAEADLEHLRMLLKQRSSEIMHRSLKKESKSNQEESKGAGSNVRDIEDLLVEFQDTAKDLDKKLKEMQKKQKEMTEGLERVKREITVCDQKETALSEERSMMELKDSIAGSQGPAHTRALNTRLRDIDHFKDSTKEQKIHLLQQRDQKETEHLKLKQDYEDAVQEKSRAQARAKLLGELRDPTRTGKSSASSESVKVADSKLRELAATNPQDLAGVGQGERFTGFREVMAISARALEDVSRALREVTAAAGEGDAAVLEDVLEANLKLRQEINKHIQERLDGVDGKIRFDNRPGMNEFFFEAEVKKKEGPAGFAAKAVKVGADFLPIRQM